jgi:hypothetical protein
VEVLGSGLDEGLRGVAALTVIAYFPLRKAGITSPPLWVIEVGSREPSS